MPANQSDCIVVLGGARAGKSTMANLLAGQRLFPVSTQTYGPFGFVARVGTVRPKTIWVRGNRGQLSVKPAGELKIPRDEAERNLIWVERTGLSSEFSPWPRILELSTAAMSRENDPAWFSLWKRRTERELRRVAALLLVVSPRGLGASETRELIQMVESFPSLRRQPVSLLLNCHHDSPDQDVDALATQVRNDVSKLLDVQRTATLRPIALHRRLSAGPCICPELLDRIQRSRTVSARSRGKGR